MISKNIILAFYHEYPLPQEMQIFMETIPEAVSNTSLAPQNRMIFSFDFNDALVGFGRPQNSPFQSPVQQNCLKEIQFKSLYDHQQVHYLSKNFIKSPFSKSIKSDGKHKFDLKDPHKKQWHYIDEFQILQGPFSSIQMDGWFESGFFFDELQIGNSSDLQNIFPLYELLLRQQNREIELKNEKIDKIQKIDANKIRQNLQSYENPSNMSFKKENNFQ